MGRKDILVLGDNRINMKYYEQQNTFQDWHRVFNDVDTVQIILYLRKHNPNVDVSTITKILSLNEERVIEILNNLKHLNAVEFSQEQKNWTLTPKGRNVANFLYKISQEQ